MRSRALPLLLAILLWVPALPAAEEPPMTQEDVVLLYVRGMPADELVRKIHASEVAFDLSDEMLDELRIAGIPAEVLAAMKERQAALSPEEPSTPKPSTDPEAGPANRLVVRLNPDWEPKKDAPLPTLRMLNSMDEEFARALGVRTANPQLEDIGIALLCRTGDHVPDQWRSKSPLGRDFNNAPRHRVLAFVSGAVAEPASKFRRMLTKLAKVPGEWETIPDLQLLTLEIPEQLEVTVEPGVAHDLTLGIVIRIADRSFLMKSDQLDAVVVPVDGTRSVRADLRAESKNPLKTKVGFRTGED